MLNEKQKVLGVATFADDEKNLLLIIFKKRLKLMRSVLLIMTV